MSDQRCGGCRFFDVGPDTEAYGWCRRFPPSIPMRSSMVAACDPEDLATSEFPSVHVMDWCGEFQPTPVDPPTPLAGDIVNTHAIGVRARKVLHRLGYLAGEREPATGKLRYRATPDRPLSAITYGELIECRNCGVATAYEIAGWLRQNGITMNGAP